MNRFLLLSSCLVICGLTAVGCSAESGDAGEGASASDSKLLLDDHFSDTGTLQVSEDADGKLLLSVQGRIGADDPAIGKASMAEPTLDGIYLVLHPEAAAPPATVHTLSARLALQASAQPRTSAPVVEAPQVQEKDAASFNSTACKTFYESSQQFSPAYCSYQVNWHGICTYTTINQADRSFFWNESPYTGRHTLSTSSSVTTAAAWTWGWSNWNNSTVGYACLTLNGSGTGGNLGITDHDWSPLVR